jgi:hypothetical protein
MVLAESVVDRDVIHDWLKAVRQSVQKSHWAPFLTTQGIDIFDAYISPLHLCLLETARREAHLKSDHGIVARIGEGLKSRYREKIWKQWFLERKARVLSADVKQAEVVFWPVEPTHIKQQLPVASRLEQMGIKYSFVTCRPGIFEMLRSKGHRAIYTREAWSQSLSTARDDGKSASVELAAAQSIPVPQFPYSSDPEVVIGCLRRTLVLGMPAVYEAAITTKEIVDMISPRVLVVGNDVTPEGRTATLFAKSCSLPTAAIMHGSVTGEPLDGEHIVDKFQVYGENCRRDLENRGADSARIEVCGAPYLDTMPIQSGEIHKTIKRCLGFREDSPMILLATSGPGHCTSLDHFHRLVESVMKLSARMPNINFVAKLHRKDGIGFYRTPLKNVPQSRLHIVANGTPGFPEDIFDWLQGCLMLLTTTSTVATEAMLMGVPVVTMDFAAEYRGVDFIEADATMHVRNQHELGCAVRAVCEPETLSKVKRRADKFLEGSYYALDRNSSLRCAEAISRMIS